MMSNMSQSFKRRFSQKSPIPLVKVDSTVPSPLRRNSFSSISGSEGVRPGDEDNGVVSMSRILECTHAKHVSTPVRLMAPTPGHGTPKRPIFAAGYGTPPLKMAKRSARAKLFTTPTKVASRLDCGNKNTPISAVDSDDGLLSFLPQSLIQSIKQKEQRAMEEKETGFADQSRQRSVMTEQELIHKIVASSTKIMDRSEVEKQLTLLKELLPEWISEKTARNGDVLCCVNATLSQTAIRQRLYASE